MEDWSPARHRVISGEEVAELLPALAGRSPSGGYLFYDCQTDDVRLVLTVLAEAERFGAVAVNGVEALGLLEEGGRAVGARVRDAASGAELDLRAANVVNATGVWADRLRPGSSTTRPRCPSSAPAAGRTSSSRATRCRCGRARSRRRAAGGRSSCSRGSARR